MVLPQPPFALDLLFTFNITMALMVAACMTRPLDFAAFPSVIGGLLGPSDTNIESSFRIST